MRHFRVEGGYVATVGERLKEERLLRGWSQRDLAREAGTTAETISSIETGQHEPRPSTLRKLAKGLGLEVRDFYKEPAVPLAETPQNRGIPQSLDALLERRGTSTRHLADENLPGKLTQAPLQEAIRIAEAVNAEAKAINPDL